MADEVGNLTDIAGNLGSDAISNMLSNLPPVLMDKLVTLISIFRILGIVFIVWLIFLIIKAVFKMRDSYRLGKILKNVEEINQKLGKSKSNDKKSK